MKKSILSMLGGLALLAQTLTAHAALNIFACEPEWAALTKELAGDKVSLVVATTAEQDPHFIQARPSLLAAVRNAQLVVCTGAELEVGWLPVLLRQAGNAAVQAGQAGNFEAANFVTRLEVPTRLDRADGDVHASGNPHLHTDPRNIALVAEALAARLIQLDPANASFYQARLRDFKQRWQSAIQRWEKEAAPLRGMRIVVQHKAWPYLQNWLGLVEVATLEPKPGVEPSSSHLAQLQTELSASPAKLIVRANFHSGRGAEWLSERTKIPVVVLPSTVGGNERAKDLFSFFDELIAQLQKGQK